jgi:CO/xanthine dehydrogenase FAD-binding subunit
MTTPAVHCPRTLDAALSVLADRPPQLRIVAGGTDIMVMLHAGVVSADALLDLWKVDELRGISVDKGTLVLGALTTYTELIRSAKVPPVMRESAATVGAAQIQNRGTVGGNLANASPAADFVPVLSALDATVELQSKRGARSVSIHDFYLGYRKTCMTPDELIVRVRIPLPGSSERTWFRKVGTRRAQAISKVVLAAALDGTRLRVAAGSVAPTVIRLRKTEAAFASGGDLKAAIAEDITPIDDVRSTAEYRRRVTTNLITRFLCS